MNEYVGREKNMIVQGRETKNGNYEKPNYRLFLRNELKNVLEFEKFQFELEVLTIAGASKCLKENSKFISLSKFIKEKLGKYQFDFKKIQLIEDYIYSENFAFRLIVNDGLENVKKDRFIIEAFVRSFIVRYFANEMNEKTEDVFSNIKRSLYEICGERDPQFFGELNRRLIMIDPRSKTAFKQYMEMASSYKNEIEYIYNKLLKEAEKRGLFVYKRNAIENKNLESVEEKNIKQSLENTNNLENRELEKFKEKIKNYELMLNMYQEQIEELKAINSELQREKEALLQDRQQLPEKILIKLFNDLNSPQFGNLLDRIYIYANGFEQADVGTAHEIFTNFLAVLSLYNIIGHLDKEEYNSEINVKKEEIGSIYRSDKPVQSAKQTFVAKVLYPRWTLNQKTIAHKFVKIIS